MDGYFCYVGLMLPDQSDSQLEPFWDALEKRLKRSYEMATGHKIEGEIKSKFLPKLTAGVRFDITRRIAYFLKKNKGCVGGFYTTVHALMCWEIRTNATYHDLANLPAYSLNDSS